MTRDTLQIPLFNLHRQYQPLKEEILKKWSTIIDHNELTFGEETVNFESGFARVAGTKYAVGVRSGTASLIVALRALGVGPDDEVITTPNTFSATADSIALVGALPVFADVEPTYGTLDPNQVLKKITKKTKAVLIVHLYGVPCQMDELSKICTERNLHLIEDASHAHGSLYRGNPVGSLGTVSCFSLYPSKTLGCAGNAGVVTTNDEELAKSVRMFAHHGIKEGQSKYTHHVIAYNELIDNLQSAVLNTKIPLLSQWIQRRRQIAEIYNTAFQKKNFVGMPWPEYTEPSLYVYAIQLKNREKFRDFMKESGIETGIYYPTPLHLQPSYKYLGYQKGDLPNAEKWMDQTVSLPLYPELTDEEVNRIVLSIQGFNF